MEYLWVQDKDNKYTHAYKIGKQKTFCLKDFNENYKYKSLYDFTSAEKCPVCLGMVEKIYRGVIV